MDMVKWIFAFAACSMAQGTLINLFPIAGKTPDLLLGLLICSTAVFRGYGPLVLSITFGLAQDMVWGALPGMRIVGYIIVFLLLRELKKSFRVDRLEGAALFLLSGILGYFAFSLCFLWITDKTVIGRGMIGTLAVMILYNLVAAGILFYVVGGNPDRVNHRAG